MSAFAGFVSFRGHDLPAGTLQRLTSALDGPRLARAQSHVEPGAVFVFRQRVIAPEDRWERQPVVDAGIVSMFDGRIDNRDSLLDDLGLSSPADDPLPDGRLALAAYQRWGKDAVPRLLGDFAWAVWDSPARHLMLARDHDVHRALFFSRGDGFVAFATGYRPLLALPEVGRDMDEVAAFDLLLTCPDESERSFYKCISWVVPAGRVVADADSIRQERVWEPGPRPPLHLADNEYVEAARAVFDQAVASRLRVLGPVVCSVSGGLDSSAVAATAVRLRSPQPVHGLAMVPTAGDTMHDQQLQYGDERPFVRALAAMHPSLQVEYLESTAPTDFELDPTALFMRGQMPIRSPSNAGWFQSIERRAIELGATTVIGGGLGNLTFSSDGLDRLSLLRQSGAWRVLLREMLALRRLHPRDWSSQMRYQLLAMLPAGLAAALRRWRWRGHPPLWQRRSLVNPDFIGDPLLAERFRQNAALLQDHWQPGGRATGLRYIVLRSRMQVEGHALSRSQSGLTYSDPFADRRVVDFCLSLPDDQFLAGGQTRRLARRAFADRLPPEILNNRLRGAQDSDWHRRMLPHRNTLMAELERVQSSKLAQRILDLPRMKRMLESWPAQPDQFTQTAVINRHLVTRALHLGQYLRWIEGGNG